MRRTDLLFALALVLLAPHAVAQGVDYPAAMRAASESYERGDKVGAIAIWERMLASLGEEKGWKVLYNLGIAYQDIGDATHAVERLDAFVRRTEGMQGGDFEERRRDALERLKAIRATHGAVRVAAPPSGSAVLVRVGNASPRPAGFVVYLAPGEHVFELHTGTARAKERTVHVVAGSVIELSVNDVQPPKNVSTEAAFPTAWLLGGAALTIASTALPIALAIHTGNERDEAESLGVTHSRYPDAVDSFEGARRAYWISYALPVALAAATAIVVILKTPRSSSGGGAWSAIHF
jgi:hypothetical protein